MPGNIGLQKFEEIALEMRKRIVKMAGEGGGGHVAPAFSAVEIITALYFGIMDISPGNLHDSGRDKFILSPGHKCLALYAALAEKGLIPDSALATFARFGSILGGHPDMRKIPGVDATTGSLGHGLPIGVGMALGKKTLAQGGRVFVLLGDGELAEGSVWEAAMAAAKFGLDNLTAIVDRNHLQVGGTTEDVMPLEPVGDKWHSFGWTVTEVDGHSFPELLRTLGGVPLAKGRPTLIIANTIKGKGVTYMENQASWHYPPFGPADAVKALAELEKTPAQGGKI